jgi:hypothetical protein
MKNYTVDMAASESQKESHKNICTVFYTAAISTNDSILKPSVSCKNNYYCVLKVFLPLTKFFISCESHILHCSKLMVFNIF